MGIPYYSGEAIRAGIDVPALVEALREGHRAPAPEMRRAFLEQPGTPNSFLVLHAWSFDDVIVSKLVTIFPGNLRSDPPLASVQSLVTVFDGATGSPVALVDGTELTYWKTAASSALAATYLARRDARSLLIVGAGGLAPFMIRAHRAVTPSIETVRIWNRTPERARSVASDPICGGPVEAVDDLEAAVRASDIVCTVTGSSEPVVRGSWLRPGTHLDLVGGYAPHMRETDDDAVRAARLFVDAAQFNIDECGDLAVPIATGVCRREDVEADHFALCRGEHEGRRSDAEITFFKSGGAPHLDLIAARHVIGSGLVAAE